MSKASLVVAALLAAMARGADEDVIRISEPEEPIRMKTPCYGIVFDGIKLHPRIKRDNHVPTPAAQRKSSKNRRKK